MTPYLYSVEFVFTQEPDDNDDAGEHELRVLVQTAGAGPYLSLQTKRWAFDDPNELNGLLQHAAEAVVPLFARYPGLDNTMIEEPST